MRLRQICSLNLRRSTVSEIVATVMLLEILIIIIHVIKLILAKEKYNSNCKIINSINNYSLMKEDVDKFKFKTNQC